MKKHEIEAAIKTHERMIEKLKELTPDDEITRDMGKYIPFKSIRYYVPNSHFEIVECVYRNDPSDKLIIDAYSSFRTKQEAEVEAKFTKLSREYRAFAKAVNGDWKADWKDKNQHKWGIAFKEEKLKVNHFYFSNYFIHQVTFKCRELAEKALELFGKDLLILANP